MRLYGSSTARCSSRHCIGVCGSSAYTKMFICEVLNSLFSNAHLPQVFMPFAVPMELENQGHVQSPTPSDPGRLIMSGDEPRESCSLLVPGNKSDSHGTTAGRTLNSTVHKMTQINHWEANVQESGRETRWCRWEGRS